MFMFDRMDEKLVRAVIETIPAEITVIDANDEVVAWNRHENRLFHRPMTSMGLNFRKCHPEHSLAKVEQIVGEMKAGKRQEARFWIQAKVGDGRHMVLLEYFALRGEDGQYLGCLEVTQDIEDHRRLEGEKRLLD
ncbi:MAG: PAS domain-containing protein [Candidatus Aminicenantes bacterium]|nr:PAS domain-containing protein [Candidatus Aminicenantes bacterium]